VFVCVEMKICINDFYLGCLHPAANYLILIINNYDWVTRGNQCLFPLNILSTTTDKINCGRMAKWLMYTLSNKISVLKRIHKNNRTLCSLLNLSP
jgi:hypothetical protein